EEIGGAPRELKLSFELSEEEEGIQLDEDVVADLALNAEAGSRGEQFSASAELDSVGGESVVGLATEAGVGTGREIDGDAGELWKSRRRIEGGMETATARAKLGEPSQLRRKAMSPVRVNLRSRREP